MKYSKAVILSLFFIPFSIFKLQAQYSFSNKDTLESIQKEKIRLAYLRNDTDQYIKETIEYSNFLKLKGNYSEAIKIVSEAEDMLQVDKRFLRALCFLHLGELNRASANWSDALIYLHEANKLFKAENSLRYRAQTFNRQGAVYFEDLQLEKALQYADSSLIFAETSQDSLLIANNYMIKGAVYDHLEEYDEALIYFHDALNVYKQAGIEPDDNVFVNLLVSYYKKGQYRKAISYGKTAYDNAREKGIKVYIETSADFLSKAYYQLGNFKKAYDYLDVAQSVRLQLSNEKKNSDILQLNKKFTNELQLAKIKNQEIKLNENRRFLFYFSLFAAVLLIFSIIMLIVWQRLRKANKLLLKKNHEISSQQERIEKHKDKILKKAADLLVLNKELKEFDELKEGLTNMLVHDLKNPVNNILYLSESKEITSIAHQMLTIVNNILDVQKYEKTEMKLDLKEVSFYKIVKDAVLQIKTLAEHKNIQIDYKAVKGIHLKVDYDIIFRVMVNFFTNSIKYTPANGKIIVHYELSENPDFIFISVKDNGIGIKSDKINMIFNKFSQVMAKRSGQARSTGLGLTFCKMAVEAHEGFIKVESVSGEYTMFKFSLPLVKIGETVEDEEIKNKDSIHLSKTDVDYLKAYIPEFEQYDVYDIGNLKQLMNQISDSESEMISQWKSTLSNAVYNCNPQEYERILKLVK